MPLKQSKTLLVVNPAAQRGNGQEMGQHAFDMLVKELGAENLSIIFTSGPRDAIDIAANADAEAIIAVGGDGVVHEVANGLMKRPRDERPTFGLIPVGSGNDYARTLGMSENLETAVSQLLRAQEKSLDVGCCNGEHFVETLSFGLDAAIALDTVERRKRTGQQGTALYFASGIDQLLHHLDTFHMEAVLDGRRTLTADVHIMAVQIGRTYGGGFDICPQADASDGLFDICYARATLSIPAAVVLFARAKNGGHTKHKKIGFELASELEIRFNRRPPVQIDGEPHIADSYSITIDREAIDVLMAR